MKVGIAAVLLSAVFSNAYAVDMVLGVGAQEGGTKAVTQQVGLAFNSDGFFQGAVTLNRFGDSVKKPGARMADESVALAAYLQPGVSVRLFDVPVDLRANVGFSIYRATLRSSIGGDADQKD